MSRGWKILVVCVIVLLALAALGMWGVWVATGRGTLAYRCLAWMCADAGLHPTATRFYRKAVRVKPGDVHLRAELADALANSGRNGEALQHYAEAARLDPDWYVPRLGEARVKRGLGALEEAEGALDKAAALAPNHAEVLLETGCLRAAENDFDEAARSLERAISADPNTLAAYEWLGYVREEQGEIDEAVVAYEEGALRGNPYCRIRLAALGKQPPAASGSYASGPSQTTGSSSTSAAAPALAFGMIGFMMVYVAFIGFMCLFSVAAWVMSLLAIFDCARRDFDDPTTRAMWCLLMALAQWIGALVYYFVIYRKNEPRLQVKRPPVLPIATT